MAVFADPFGSYVDGYRQGYDDYLKALKAGKASGENSNGGNTTPPGQIPPATGDDRTGAKSGSTPDAGGGLRSEAAREEFMRRKNLPGMTGDQPAAPAPVPATPAPANVPLPPPRPPELGGTAPTPFDATPAQAAPPAPSAVGGRVQTLETFLQGLPPPPPLPDPMTTFPAPPRQFLPPEMQQFVLPRTQMFTQDDLNQMDYGAMWTPRMEADRRGQVPSGLDPRNFDAYERYWRPQGAFDRNPFRPRSGVMIP